MVSSFIRTLLLADNRNTLEELKQNSSLAWRGRGPGRLSLWSLLLLECLLHSSICFCASPSLAQHPCRPLSMYLSEIQLQKRPAVPWFKFQMGAGSDGLRLGLVSP